MTFYEKIKNVLKEKIETFNVDHSTEDYEFHDTIKVEVFNDVTTFLLKNQKLEDNELILIIKTGMGTTSKVEGLVMTSYPLYITGICKQNSLKTILEILSQFIQDNNGKVIADDDGYYNLGFEEASVQAVDQTIQLKKEEIKASIINLVGNALVSEEDIAMPTFTFDYEVIDRVQSYTDSYINDFSSLQEKDHVVDDVSYNGATRTWQLSLIKSSHSNFQKYLMQKMNEHQLSGKHYLTKDTVSYTVVIQNISEALSQQIGVPVIVINFQEVRSEG